MVSGAQNPLNTRETLHRQTSPKSHQTHNVDVERCSLTFPIQKNVSACHSRALIPKLGLKPCRPLQELEPELMARAEVTCHSSLSKNAFPTRPSTRFSLPWDDPQGRSA
ncbi:hypothetical protein NPIL_426421 [Nephila pilipes]|uniref:Uncharacterized protein n=1 Tax=Nephila pilipes TaxID=299642 RepID=A0A8X6UFJ7_NEPPI|nr:hypothetical protein NPIL_426421 [Nephila pilipes]